MSGKSVLVINGPNLNMLGHRDPAFYGTKTLAEINQDVETLAQSLDIAVSFFQSNHEGVLIDAIQQARSNTDALILNPGAYGHTSIALRDAVSDYPHLVIEVHLSNLHAREEFRHHSYISGVAKGVICGLGPNVYRLALQALAAEWKG